MYQPTDVIELGKVGQDSEYLLPVLISTARVVCHPQDPQLGQVLEVLQLLQTLHIVLTDIQLRQLRAVRQVLQSGDLVYTETI